MLKRMKWKGEQNKNTICRDLVFNLANGCHCFQFEFSAQKATGATHIPNGSRLPWIKTDFWAMVNVAFNLAPVKAANTLFIDPGRSFNRTQWCARECVFVVSRCAIVFYCGGILCPSVQMFPGHHWSLMSCHYIRFIVLHVTSTLK